jgi:hypothetical protein
MTPIDRRSILKSLLGGAAAAATFGLALGPAEAAPLTLDTNLVPPLETPVEKARTTVVHHHRGGRTVVHHHHRRRHTCWWHRGRRVCGWR